MSKIAHDPDEILAVVDDKNGIVGKEARRIIHEKGLWHREVYNYILTSEKKVLLHKRLDMHLWDHSCSGHFPHDQNYMQAAQREFEEELGIKLEYDDFQELGIEKIYGIRPDGSNDNRFAKIYLVKKDISIEDFKIDPQEIEGIRYFNRNALECLLSSQKRMITDSARQLIPKYILSLLK